jgi:hypothetical protein
MKTSLPTPANTAVKAPPLLLGAALVFWGWQSGFLMIGVLLAVVLESARRVNTRWDLSDEDFNRIWNFCTVLILAAAIFAFKSSEGPGGINGLLRGPAVAVGNKISLSGEHTATALLRWLPMILFPVVVAQAFSLRESVPVSAISLILRWRRRREQKRGRTMVPVRRTDVFYPYFILCLFSAGIHLNQGDETFFWGLAALLVWALWPFRSRRFGIAIWGCILVLALAAGYWGQNGLGRFEQWVEGYNVQWLAHFLRQRTDPKQNVTALGQIGRLKLSGRIAIRLRPQGGGPPPTYLREASYRNYRSPTWLAGRARYDYEYLSHETNETTWVLLPDKTNSAAVNIACSLAGTSRESGNPTGLLPLPTGSGRLEKLNVYLLQKSRTGAVLAEGPGLVIFDADYGPGATLDVPPNTNWDCQVPTNEMPALDQVVSEMKLSGRDENETLRRVRAFFQDQFSYSTWLGPGTEAATRETPLSRFLLHRRSGHCEYFATATTLLLRRLEIPTRYAVGYVVHEAHGDGYVVRERDAHAWCLVWDKENQIWRDFDTTPASWIAAEGKRASSLQRISDFWSDVLFQLAKLRWGGAEWRRYVLWILAPVLAVLLYQIVFRRRRQRLHPKPGGGADLSMSWPGLDSEFYQLEAKLAERGVARRPSEPLSGWLARALADPALKDLQVPLQELLRLHYRHRFDPQGLNGKEREALSREAKVCLDALARTK